MYFDKFRLDGRVAFVTGGAQGIGLAAAEALAEAGATVVIGDCNEIALSEAASLLSDKAYEVDAEQLDVTDSAQVSEVAEAIVARHGHVDILVNNAGGSRPLPVDAPDSKWDEAIALNFTSYRRIAHALLPQMIERKWGRIVNITGKSEPEGLNAAFAAKAAVHAWAKGLSREIGEHGITINCIPPGRIMSEQIRRNYPPDYRERFAEEEIPVGYWGEPEDLAALAVFLASRAGAFVTGQTIVADGGVTITG